MAAAEASVNPAEFANIAKSERDLWWFQGMNQILFPLLRQYAPDARNVLEGGCGTGYLSLVLQQELGWNMTAIDLSEVGLGYAHGRYGLDRLAAADLQSLPFADCSFDAVLSMDVLVHFPKGEETRAVSELVRVLRPGGTLFLRVSALDILRSRHSQFAHERQRFTRTRLIHAVERTGIQVLRCTYANSLLMPVALTKFRVWEPLTNQPPASGVEPVSPWLNRLLRIPLELEAKWISAGLNFPAGQSLVLAGRKAAAGAGSSRARTTA
jgi:SAM-dependent methyltransferase